MGKYAEAIGVWDHKLGSIEHKLTPKTGDNLKLSKIMESSEKGKIPLDKLMDFYYGLVVRDYPELLEDERKELKDWVEMNIVQIMKDVLIAFRWTTPEKLNELEKGDFLKNLVP